MVRVGITHTARVRVRMKGSRVESRVKVTVGVRAKTGKACFFRVTVCVRAEAKGGQNSMEVQPNPNTNPNSNPNPESQI